MTGPTARRIGVIAQVGHVARLVWAERRPYLTGAIFVAFSCVSTIRSFLLDVNAATMIVMIATVA